MREGEIAAGPVNYSAVSTATHIPEVTFKEVSFSAKVSSSFGILDLFPGFLSVLTSPSLFYIVNTFLSVTSSPQNTEKGSSLSHLTHNFLPLHISYNYSPLTSSSHPKFSRKFSILAVSICSPPTYSSVHFTLSSTPITGFKKTL